jgi:hypothetical protein
MSGVDMLAAAWVVIGLASGLWMVFHAQKFIPHQSWIMRLAWPYQIAPRQQLLNHAWIIGGEETISWQTQAEIDTYLDPLFRVAREENP